MSPESLYAEHEDLADALLSITELYGKSLANHDYTKSSMLRAEKSHDHVVFRQGRSMSLEEAENDFFEALAEKEILEQRLKDDREVYEENLSKAAGHYAAHEVSYHTQAIEEASGAGIQINFNGDVAVEVFSQKSGN